MQAPTHILTGWFIERAFSRMQMRGLAIALMLPTGLLMHAICDKLANLTYHPANADFSDPFWVGYHFVVLITTVVMLYLYWSTAKWGILFSIIPDFDWIMVHGQNILGLQSGIYDQPYIHNTLNWVMDNVPPFYFLNLLPNWRLSPWAFLVEVGLLSVLLYLIQVVSNARRNIHFGK